MIDIQQLKLPQDVPSLKTFYFYLTHGCNLACQHCWLSPEFQRHNGSTGGHLDFSLFKQAVDEGIPLGLSNAKLTGGEPLLHPDFRKIIDYLSDRDIQVTIETNGTLLTEELARYLKDHSSTWFISVSIDGASAETHDKFRGVKGSFAKACNAVRFLSQAGFAPQIIMSLHEGNVHEISKTVRLAEDLGAASVKFNLIQATGRGEVMKKRNRVLDTQRLIDLGKWVQEELQKKTTIQLYYSWPIAFEKIQKLLLGDSASCSIFTIMGVLSSGHYAMCGIGVQIPELLYGQIGENKLEDVWVNNKMLKQLRQDLPAKLEGVCKQCILKQTCLGNCVASMYHLTGKLTSSDWFCQQAFDQDLFPKQRLENAQLEK